MSESDPATAATPLPPPVSAPERLAPEVLADYERITPGLASAAARLAVLEYKHRLALDAAMLEEVRRRERAWIGTAVTNISLFAVGLAASTVLFIQDQGGPAAATLAIAGSAVGSTIWTSVAEARWTRRRAAPHQQERPR